MPELRLCRASSTRWSPSIRCTCARARGAGSCSSRNSSRPKRSSPSTPTSRLLHVLGRACTSRTSRRSGSGSTSAKTTSSSSSRRTTATSSSTSSAPGSPCSESTRPRTSRGGRGARRPDSRRVLRARDGGAARRRGQARRASSSATTSSHRFPDLNDFVAGVASCSPLGDGDLRVSAPAPPARRRGVRHDLPRALLVLFVLDVRADPRGARPRRLRRRGARRRTAARCASTRSMRAGRIRPRMRSARLRAATRTGGLGTPERYARFAEDVQESKRALLELLIALRRDGKPVVGLRSAGQGQHASQLLRHPHRPARVHGRPQPLQARAITRRGRTSPSIRPSASPRPGPTTSSSCPGTLSTRSLPSSRTSPIGARS